MNSVPLRKRAQMQEGACMRIILKPLGAAAVAGTIVVLVSTVFILSRVKPTPSSSASGPSSPSVTKAPLSQMGITDWASKVGTQLDSMEVASPESENKHKIRGEKTETGRSPIDPVSKYRHALTGGWFGFNMKVDSQKPTLLVLRYWGDEPNLRVFDIVVDGTPIATERLLHNVGRKYYEIGYPLPMERTRGKSQIEVKLVGKTEDGATGWAGGIFLAKTYDMK
jgi:hypothetical protein